MAELAPITKTHAALRSRARPLPAESEWQPLVALRNAIDRAFDEFTSGWPLGERMFRLRPWAQLPVVIGAAAPAADVVEQDDQFTLAVEMPGMAAKDIDVSLSDDLLTVRGEKPETREEKESYRLSERHHGLFQRSFRIPPSVDAGRIEATYQHGILEIVLPKTDDARRKQLKIPSLIVVGAYLGPKTLADGPHVPSCRGRTWRSDNGIMGVKAGRSHRPELGGKQLPWVRYCPRAQ